MNISKSLVLLACSALCTAPVLQSCDDDDDDSVYVRLLPNALVTVKTAGADTLYLQLDEQTTLYPVNLAPTLFGGRQVRALVNYSDAQADCAHSFSKAVYVNWIDCIRTKPMAADLGLANDSVYGTDPVEIVRDWVTIAEDGYLTLRFRTLWGSHGTVHHVNLVDAAAGTDTAVVEFRHHAHGDTRGHLADALVAFRLDRLPAAATAIELRWASFDGPKKVTFSLSTAAIATRPAIAMPAATTRAALQ